MQRMGMAIHLKSEKMKEYKELHTKVWPEILQTIWTSNIRNYSIFLKEPENILFGYWEYVGSDFALDMEKMAADQKTQLWWEVCMPCQEPFENRKDGEWWSMLEEVFHYD